MLSMEPYVGLDLTTLESLPEQKARVGCHPGAPQFKKLFRKNRKPRDRPLAYGLRLVRKTVKCSLFFLTQN